jgi:AcrR family transcriptional regulator
MSPRGKTIPDIRDRLFRAGEELLIESGPGAISARAVAARAGVASGALYNHFDDLDHYLAELVLDRFRVQADLAAALPGRSGTGTVVGNLADALAQLLQSPTLAIAELVHSRLGLSVRVTRTLDEGAPGMAEIHGAIVAYLEAERRQGRIAAGADAEAAALMMLGALHHLMLLHGSELADARRVAERVANAAVNGLRKERG